VYVNELTVDISRRSRKKEKRKRKRGEEERFQQVKK